MNTRGTGFSLGLILILLLVILGCSSGSNTPVVPAEPTRAEAAETSHRTWGLWQFTANPGAGTLDVVQLRTGNFHLNVLPFLEPPPLVNLTLESVEFNGNIIETDIGLRHPFIGLDEFSGFDVCGIIITNGSVSGFADPDLQMAGEEDMRLLNPDGLSRWWNPAEFPNDGTIFGYIDGLLGAPDSFADYNCTLNAYKYFCNDLDADDQLSDVTLASRGMFSAGQKNIRHYTIDLGDEGLIFNYAIDACWVFPNGTPPYQAPDDFPPEANREEAWRAEVTEVNNTLWNDGAGSGGGLQLSIDAYDWFNAGMNTVKIESPGNFTIATSAVPIGGGAGYSTYGIEITDATPDEGSIDILISVESEVDNYGGLLPGETVTAYFTHTSSVSGEPAGDFIYVDDSNTSGIEDGSMAHPYNTIQEGVDAAPVTYTVLVDDSGVAYAEEVEMKSDIILKSENWDDSDGTGRAFIDGPDDLGTHSVYFNNVTDTLLEGFQVGIAGECGGTPISTEMIRIDGGAGITIKDCLFTGQTDWENVYPIAIDNSSGVEITNCRMDEIDRDGSQNGCRGFWGIYTQTCPNLTISNNIFTNIRSTEDGARKYIYCIHITGSDGAVVRNNLIHHIVPKANGMYIYMYGFHFEGCSGLDVANNTVDNLDGSWSGVFPFAQAMGYYFKSCDVDFTDNIGTHIYGGGWPVQVGHGVQAENCSVVCNFTDIWNVSMDAYSGGASVGIGCISADPFYIDPGNEEYDIFSTSPAQQGDPSFVDWDDTGSASNDPMDTDTNTRSRMGCHGGPDGEVVGLLT